jgi:hypothetical protein
MCRRAEYRGPAGAKGARAALSLAAALWAAACAWGQEQGEAPVDVRTAADSVEAYMERLGLKRLQAEDLARRVQNTSPGQDRVTLAERLGKLYVQLLSEARTPEERRQWEGRSRDLLRLVPEADSSELRLSLTKALHLQASEVAERHRMRLATPEESAEAERVLRSIKPQLDEIAQKVNRRVEQLEALEDRGEVSDRLSDELAEGRRVRSQAFYYLGWTDYYISMLTGSDDAAFDALKSFGWLLNSKGGRVPSLDRIPKNLFRYEHVARSAAGVALATAQRGNHAAALAWLDAIEEADDVAESVRGNLVTWRIAVLASSKRWADLERFVRLTRNSDRTGGGANVQPLGVAPARLLAVVTLEADQSLTGDVVGPLSAIAMGDLVSAGEIGHVIDLVQRYGTKPLGEKGFIVNYVRGIQQYELAREAHKAAAAGVAVKAGETPASELPTTDARAVEAYRLAGTLLKGAVEETDAGSFAGERARASQLWGFTLFYTGELEAAADRFSETARMAGSGASSEEAMWLAVLSLDYAVEKGATALTKRRDEAAALFLQTHPDSAHAPKLLLRRAIAGALEPEEAVRILLGVEKDSALYGASRQHATRLLYQIFRTARGSDRDFAAVRFVGVAEETLAMDRRVAMNPDDPGAKDAAERVVARVRQILDALLGAPSVDPARAESAIEVLESVATAHKLDMSGYANELLFRRFQIAVAKGDTSGAAALVSELQGKGDQFAVAADQILYKRALQRREKGEQGAEVLRDIVTYGDRVIGRMIQDPSAMKDNVVLSLHQAVAEAATELWKKEQDGTARAIAVTTDTRLLEAQPRNQAALRRLAMNAEGIGDSTKALDCWRTLLSGLEQGSEAWFEARYESLRLLAASEPGRAKQVMAQHLVLFPDYGPEPWGSKLKKLDADLAKVPSPAPSGGAK